MPHLLTRKFCRCVKAVAQKFNEGEKASIPICVKSVLGKRGRTIKKFNCRRGILRTTKARRNNK
jgi:hypothetical protein